MVPGTPRIKIPDRFKELLGDSPLAGALQLYVKRFDAWVSDDAKGLFFFPEYSDHGPKHITSVLFGAEALIRKEAWQAVTPEDVAVLIGATLFHDAAMHLSADGFLALIDPKRAGERPLIRPLDTQTWPELFAVYYSEACKWDQRRLHRILGDEKVPQEEEPDLIDSVRRPEEMPNPETWSTRYRKFLGEFVRRHHARLAHEIALYGYPGHTSDALKLPDELARLTDLAGLVARSHNMHLRDTFGYLKEKYDRRVECLRTHPVFLMVLLRIADYLEIRSDRINPTAHAIQRLRSPISLEEHSSHLAVHDVQWPDEDDEEAVFVSAQPESARLFLKMQSLLKGLQAELDTSWAVLGEVYSKQQKFSSFGISLRRVRSNLDSPAEYLQRRNPDYFPVRAAFDTTGADLLKLLIKPLYGDRPEIGVRELLQNALDAVHELRQWAANHGDPGMKKIPLPEQEADVLISVDKDETGEAWLTIRDKGIGMTVEIVRDYFLKAGASYRESTAWREDFEDEFGANVLRSGRFGIGALASFLLGERIEVFTRHVGSPVDSGIRFTASIVDDVIELKRESLSFVGTTVRVRLSDNALKQLIYVGHFPRGVKWDWFTLEDPKVERRVWGEELNQRYHFPLPGEFATKGWSEISVTGLRSVAWGFEEHPRPLLVCNGIIVKEYFKDDLFLEQGWLEVPSVSVFDSDGKLPLNLQRDDLVGPGFPFWGQIEGELVREMCAFLLIHAPTQRRGWLTKFHTLSTYVPPLFRDCAVRRVDVLRSRFDYLYPVCFSGQGTSLLRFSRVGGLGKSLLCFVMSEPSVLDGLALSGEDSVSVLFSASGVPISYAANALSQSISFSESRVLSRRQFLKRSDEKPTLLDSEWGLIGQKELRGSSGQFEEFVRNKSKREVPGLHMVLELALSAAPPSSSRIDRMLGELLDSPVIPYDPAERRQKLPRAFAQLEKYLKPWEPGNLAGWRLDMVRWFHGEFIPEEWQETFL